MNETVASQDFVLVFAGAAPPADGEVRRGLGDSARGALGRVSEVAVSTLQANMQAFLKSLNVILSAPPDEIGGLSLEQVELTAEIDASGNIGFLSFAGAETSAHGGIKLILRKKS